MTTMKELTIKEYAKDYFPGAASLTSKIWAIQHWLTPHDRNSKPQEPRLDKLPGVMSFRKIGSGKRQITLLSVKV